MSNKPLIYSCSGCSNVAQLANDLAVIMDREKHAQMSSIVGVGAHVKNLVQLAKSGRSIVAVDGCDVGCVKKSLALHNIEPTWHVELTALGIKRVDGESCSYSDMNRALHLLQKLLQDNLA